MQFAKEWSGYKACNIIQLSTIAYELNIKAQIIQALHILGATPNTKAVMCFMQEFWHWKLLHKSTDIVMGRFH